jgi:WD40 repeat protein
MAGHRFRITNMVFSADGRTLFSGEDGGTAVSEVRAWRVPTGDLLGTLFSRKDSGVLALLISRANDLLLIHHGTESLQMIPLRSQIPP